MVTKMVLFNSKKGLSPLIAAVLLIVVVVGIGAVVTGIVREQITQDKQTIEKTATDIECSTQYNMAVPTYNDDFRICIGSDYLNFTIENIGNIEIDELQVKLFGDSGFYDNDSIPNSNFAPGQVLANFEVYFDPAEVGSVEEVFIVPKKKVTGQTNKLYCNEAQLKFNDIETC